jgi:flagellar motor switch protein FliN/FliY
MAEQPNEPDNQQPPDPASGAGGSEGDAADAFGPEAADDAGGENLDAVGMAEQALADTEQAVGELGEMADARNMNLPNFQQVLADVEASGLDLLNDVQLHVKIELGRTSMYVEDVLKLAEGSVVELDKLAGDPVDVYVNDRLVARGEVLVLNDSFCVRVSEIIGDETPRDEGYDSEPAATETAGAVADSGGADEGSSGQS